MKIEVWSDFLCPYCVLGKKRLENALREAGLTDAQIEMKSFLLNPGEQPKGQSMREHLKEKYNYSDSDVTRSFQGLAQAAQELHTQLNFETAFHAGTDRAHSLFQYAKTQGKGTEMSDRLQQAGFIEGKQLDDEDTLVKLALEVGLNEQEARAALHERSFAESAQTEYEDGLRYGARGVPFFIVDGRYAISGAQNEEIFIKTLNKAKGH